MEYKSMDSDLQANTSGGLLGSLKGLDDIDVDTICSSADFVVRHVITPAVEATIAAYMRNCTSDSEHIISDQWSLCTTGHDFNCDDVYTYSSQCKARRDSCVYTTTTAKPGTMERLMDDSAGVLLLVGLVLIGILLGVASTVAVCLMCPQTHRWANSKLRNTAESEKKARESVVSDYYTAIDERHNNVTLQLRPVKPRVSDSSTYSETREQVHPSAPRDFENSTYTDSGAYSITSATRAQHPEDQPSTSQENAPVETYEPLSRNDPHKQSHNYAHIDAKSPDSPCSPDAEHSYFVLEKNT